MLTKMVDGIQAMEHEYEREADEQAGRGHYKFGELQQRLVQLKR